MKGWKTLVFGLIVTILGFLEGVQWVDILPEGNYRNVIIMGIGIVIMYLRAVTNTPMTKKE